MRKALTWRGGYAYTKLCREFLTPDFRTLAIMAKSVQIIKLNELHDALIEFMIVNPNAGLRITSEHFGLSQSWLSIIKNSDAFKALYDSKRDDHFSRLSTTLVEKIQGLAEVGIDELTKRIEEENEDTPPISTPVLRDVTSTALKSLGFGQPKAAANGVQNNNQYNIVVADKEGLARAREKIAHIQESTESKVIEAKTEEIEVEEIKEIKEIINVPEPEQAERKVV